MSLAKSTLTHPLSCLVLSLGLLGGCQPDDECHEGRVLVEGACVEPEEDGGVSGADGGDTMDAAAASAPDAAIVELAHCEEDGGMAEAEPWGMSCTPGEDECGSLECSPQGEYCSRSGCALDDPCSCGPGMECTSFGEDITACVLIWGRSCATHDDCRGDAQLCTPGANYCTNVCDPANPLTCPEGWSCVETPNGDFCSRPE